MGVEHDAKAVDHTAMDSEEKPVPNSTDSAAPMDQFPSHNQRKERQKRGNSDARGRGGRENKRKDMGRGEWRYVDSIVWGCKFSKTD